MPLLHQFLFLCRSYTFSSLLLSFPLQALGARLVLEVLIYLYYAYKLIKDEGKTAMHLIYSYTMFATAKLPWVLTVMRFSSSSSTWAEADVLARGARQHHPIPRGLKLPFRILR